jgi:hypothetical protein
MNDITLIYTAIVHTLHARLGRSSRPAGQGDARDRGDVSLSQVLWFVAAGVGVAVIAGIVWTRIRDEAKTPIVTPAAP